MTPDNPASATGQAPQPNPPRRDQLLLSTPRTLQQPLDFHTDSVNQTYVASPSPGPAHNTKRNTLGEAFRHTVWQPSQSGQDDRPDEEQSPFWTNSCMPLPGSIPGYESLHASPTRASPTRASPTRGSPKPASPIRRSTPVLAESTPPKEIAEAYVRIQAELYLAEGSTESSSDEASSQRSGRASLPPARISLPPSPLTAPRTPSPTMEQDSTPHVEHPEIKENVNDDEELASQADTFVKEEHTTSSLDSEASKYSRDLQRVKSATVNETKAFSKARIGETAGLTVENLNRQNGSNESLNSTKSAATFSQPDSDPGMNVPKAWGTKAKADNDWLSRINARKENRATATTSDRRSLIEGIKSSTMNRREAKNFKDSHASKIPLPSSNLKLSGRTNSSSSTPTFPTQTKPSMDQRPNLNVDDEFTGRSLQASDSPPIRIKDYAPASTSGHEIAKLTEQAVTTNRLGQLRERESQDQLSKTIPSRASPELKREGVMKRQPSASQAQETVKTKQGHDHNDSQLAAAGADKTKSGIVKGVVQPSPTNLPMYKSYHDLPPQMRETHKILQRLAKASSASPSSEKLGDSKPEDSKPEASSSSAPAKPTSPSPSESAPKTPPTPSAPAKPTSPSPSESAPKTPPTPSAPAQKTPPTPSTPVQKTPPIPSALAQKTPLTPSPPAPRTPPISTTPAPKTPPISSPPAPMTPPISSTPVQKTPPIASAPAPKTPPVSSPPAPKTPPMQSAPVQKATQIPRAPVQKATKIPSAPPKPTTEIPSAPAKKATQIPSAPAKKTTQLPSAPPKQVSQIPTSGKEMKTPIVTGAWIDSTAKDVTQTAEPRTAQKTPFVTGGWIDTPLPAAEAEKSQTHTQASGKGDMPSKDPAVDPVKSMTEQASTQPSDSQPESLQQPLDSQSEGTQQPLDYSGPPLPKSALENILTKVKSGASPPELPGALESIPEGDEPTLQLGDSTIASLEDLVAQSSAQSTMVSSKPPMTSTMAEPSAPSQAAPASHAGVAEPSSKPGDTAAKPSSKPEETVAERKAGETAADVTTKPEDTATMLKRLDAIAPSMRDSKSQLAKLERSISTPAPTTTSSTLGAGAAQCHEAGVIHDFYRPCPICDPWVVPLTLPIPLLWRWRRDNGRFELTTLGMLLLFAFVMILAEIWARAKYAHPLYADSMVGFGVDAYAPDPPFMLAKVIWRETGWEAMPWFVRSTWRTIKIFRGWWAGTMTLGGILKAGQVIKARGGLRAEGGGWDGLMSVGEDDVM